MSQYNAKKVAPRYIVLFEDTFDELDIYERAVYQALRFHSDYSQKCSSVTMSLKQLAKKAGLGTTKLKKCLNTLEFTHYIIKRTNSDNFKHGEKNDILVAQNVQYFKTWTRDVQGGGREASTFTNNASINNPYSPLAGDELSGDESDDCSNSVELDNPVVADSSTDQSIEERQFTRKQLKDLPDEFYEVAFKLFYFYYSEARKYTQGHKSPLFRKHLRTGASNFIKIYDKNFSLSLLREYFEALQYACPWLTGVRELPDRTERYGLATFMRSDRMHDILDKVNNP